MKRNRTKRKPFLPQVERLEGREMMAAAVTAQLSSGVLKIYGTSGNDTVTVRQGNGIAGSSIAIDGVRINVGGNMRSSVSLQSVSKIEISVYGGNDRVDLSPSSYEAVSVRSLIFAGSGNDWIRGGSGNDELQGGSGDDKLFGGFGNDLLFGQADNDYLWGDSGNDELQGGSGNDRLMGGPNNDRLFGDSGVDILWGEDGNDMLNGGSGKDTMYGGAGSDSAYMSEVNETVTSTTEAVHIPLIGGNPQQHNKCGPNSAFRVINKRGGLATEQQIIDAASRSSLVSKWALGTTGSTLVDAMNANRRGLGDYRFSLKTKSSLAEIVKHVREGKPAVVMVETSGSQSVKIGGFNYSIPNLHWVAVDGFDDSTQRIFFTDTNGGRYSQSYSDFNSRFNWNFGTIANKFLQGMGVVKGTFIV